jgi:hypothetical protein
VGAEDQFLVAAEGDLVDVRDTGVPCNGPSSICTTIVCAVAGAAPSEQVLEALLSRL